MPSVAQSDGEPVHTTRAVNRRRSLAELDDDDADARGD